jgi:Asp/Glu/hydantoin racemase
MKDEKAIQLFGEYMKLTGTPSLKDASGADPKLSGKRLGVVNGSNWVSLWSTYFGQKMLPGVKIINTGNEAVQLNFMKAHHEGRPCPPQINIDLFCQHAEDLYKLYDVDAILISCSTMNRAFSQVSDHMKQFNIPVVQIDEAMMEEAVNSQGNILVIATHGPTVKSTQDLLTETAKRLGKQVNFAGATIENAFELLGEGKIEEHNEAIAATIHTAMAKEKIDIVVLAQMSMSIFSFSYPNSEKEFGVKVLNSGETGFARVGEVLRDK